MNSRHQCAIYSYVMYKDDDDYDDYDDYDMQHHYFRF